MTDLEHNISSINKQTTDMKKLYDKEYLDLSIEQLKDVIDDLQKWSVWNQDEYGDEFSYLSQVAEKITSQIK